MKKILGRIGAALITIVLVALIGIWCLWGNEIRTIASIREVCPADPAHKDGAVYQMEVAGDYYFDEFLAQGGVSSDAELIAFITGNITKGLIPMNIELSEIACSAFTATTADGHRVMGRNYDMSPTNTAIVRTNPGGGRHASVSTVDLQFISIDPDEGVDELTDKILMLAAPFVPLDGVNDAGLACGIFMTFQGAETVATDQCTSKPDLTSTTMLRMVLDYCSTVDEAIAMIEEYDLHDSAQTSYHYMISDATGASAVLEWVAATDDEDNNAAARELVITRNTDDARCGADAYQVVTNFILAEGYYDGCDESEMKGLDRYDYLLGSLQDSEGEVEDDQAAMDLLAGVGRRSWKIDGDTTNGTTIHSVVFDLTEPGALWVGNEHYGEDAYTFEMSVG